MAHLRRATVNRQGRDASVLETAREVDDGHVRLRPPADTRLDGDRNGHALHHEPRHGDHRVGVTKPARAGAAPCGIFGTQQPQFTSM